MEIDGTCYALFAYDVGFSIDLDRARKLLAQEGRQGGFKRTRRGATHADLTPTPVRLTQRGGQIEVGTLRTSPSVELVLYEFGAISTCYGLPVAGELERLVAVSDNLYDNEALLEDSRRHVEQLVAILADTVEKPSLSDLVEDYVIFELQSVEPPPSLLWAELASTTARILRAEPGALSEQEIADAVSQRLSYSPDDVVMIDWFGALLVGEEMEDERQVLEFATVALLELRLLDSLLDDGIDTAYELMSRPRGWIESFKSPADGTRDVGELQADGAILFEGINNALKLLGDQYLARMYRVVSQRLHLSEWDSSIERKLGTLDSIYQKLSDRAENRRLEALEWIIIILIAVSIVVYFIPGLD